MYRKREFLYMLHRICIEISDIVFGRNQPTAGHEALIQAWACSAIPKVRRRRELASMGYCSGLSAVPNHQRGSDTQAVRTLASCRIAI
jgi:hypothetical protein